ncbi:ABC transporter ATP-binding protein [Streptomyces sp. BE230]|uniref:ABC transporter ATP-binding protein n=1 Tax=Streptomyces sp. BE230 TaxID=3002526 RepID=UPI002ED0B16B|nr:ABC transporter ATP-binding protein [Streptomyces sp. BE230]
MQRIRIASPAARAGLRERLALLRLATMADRRAVVALLAFEIAQCLLPASFVFATAALMRGALNPGVLPVGLAFYGAALLLGHALEAAIAPMRYLVKVQIEGRRRGQIARIATQSTTIVVIESPEVQELIRVAKADPENWTERTVGDGLTAYLSLVSAMIGAIASCLVLASLAWWLAPALIVPGLLGRAVQNRQGAEFFNRWREGIPERMRAETWTRMLSAPALGKEVRVFGYSAFAADRMRTHLLRMYEPVWAVAVRTLRAQRLRFLLVAGTLGAVYMGVTLSAAHGRLSVPEATAVFAAAWSVLQLFEVYDAREIVGALPAAAAYQELTRLLTDEEPEVPAVRLDPVPAEESRSESPRTLARFESVAFGYPGTRQRVVDGLDLEIRAGELLAIVGTNGAGKSTLMKLLAGLYRPDAGRIAVRGRDLREIDLDLWRSSISIVFQDFAKYRLTLGENIALGQARVPFDASAVESAAEQVGLDALARALPQGFDTPLTRTRPGGVELSGGQWQQVLLARAMYALGAGTELLVLDEPTAHLDVRTEFEVFDRLAAVRESAGVVLISHRLSTVRHADRIAVIDQGRISQEGTHDSLMEEGGLYRRMFDIQAERFNSEGAV